MGVVRALRPLVAGTTYRRGLHLLLGGVLLLPYALLGGSFVRMVREPEAPLALTVPLVAGTAVVGCVPAFLRGTRALEISAARLLLGVDLPDPPVADGRAGDRGGHGGPGGDHGPFARETRVRAALWFAVHLLVGGVVGSILVVAVPLALSFALVRSGPFAVTLDDLGLGAPGGIGTGGTVALTLAGVLLLVGAGYAVAGLGALAAVMAPVLLGPSPAERIATLEADARRLAERNRLARELHDSVGHALTVAVLQASAAGEVLDRDPEFVRRALAAIADTGRAAMDDLDHVLGVLRDGPAGATAPRRTLADLSRLVAEAGAAGRPVTLESDGTVDDVPAGLSREGYRLAQEGLTNALRHAGSAPVTVRVEVTATGLTVEVTNALEPVPAHRPAGRDDTADPGGVGIAGMRERVTLLGGRLTAGPQGGRWVVRAELPR